MRRAATPTPLTANTSSGWTALLRSRGLLLLVLLVLPNPSCFFKTNHDYQGSLGSFGIVSFGHAYTCSGPRNTGAPTITDDHSSVFRCTINGRLIFDVAQMSFSSTSPTLSISVRNSTIEGTAGGLHIVGRYNIPLSLHGPLTVVIEYNTLDDGHIQLQGYLPRRSSVTIRGNTGYCSTAAYEDKNTAQHVAVLILEMLALEQQSSVVVVDNILESRGGSGWFPRSVATYKAPLIFGGSGVVIARNRFTIIDGKYRSEHFSHEEPGTIVQGNGSLYEISGNTLISIAPFSASAEAHGITFTNANLRVDGVGAVFLIAQNTLQLLAKRVIVLYMDFDPTVSMSVTDGGRFSAEGNTVLATVTINDGTTPPASMFACANGPVILTGHRSQYRLVGNSLSVTLTNPTNAAITPGVFAAFYGATANPPQSLLVANRSLLTVSRNRFAMTRVNALIDLTAGTPGGMALQSNAGVVVTDNVLTRPGTALQRGTLTVLGSPYVGQGPLPPLLTAAGPYYYVCRNTIGGSGPGGYITQYTTAIIQQSTGRLLRCRAQTATLTGGGGGGKQRRRTRTASVTTTTTMSITGTSSSSGTDSATPTTPTSTMMTVISASDTAFTVTPSVSRSLSPSTRSALISRTHTRVTRTPTPTPTATSTDDGNQTTTDSATNTVSTTKALEHSPSATPMTSSPMASVSDSASPSNPTAMTKTALVFPSNTAGRLSERRSSTAPHVTPSRSPSAEGSSTVSTRGEESRTRRQSLPTRIVPLTRTIPKIPVVVTATKTIQWAPPTTPPPTTTTTTTVTPATTSPTPPPTSSTNSSTSTGPRILPPPPNSTNATNVTTTTTATPPNGGAAATIVVPIDAIPDAPPGLSATLVTAAAVAGAMDLQALGVLQLSPCGQARAPPQSGAFRLLSPAALNDSCEGVIYGSALLLASLAVLSTAAVAVFMLVRKVPVVDACAAVRCPSIALALCAVLLNGFLLCGANLFTTSAAGPPAVVVAVMLPIAFVALAGLLGTRSLYQRTYHRLREERRRGDEDDDVDGDTDGGEEKPSRSGPLSIGKRLCLAAALVALPMGDWGTDDDDATPAEEKTDDHDDDVEDGEAGLRWVRSLGSVVGAWRRPAPAWALVPFAGTAALLPVLLGRGAMDGGSSSACASRHYAAAGLHGLFALCIAVLRPRRVLLADLFHCSALLLNGGLVAATGILFTSSTHQHSGAMAAARGFATAQTVLTILRLVHVLVAAIVDRCCDFEEEEEEEPPTSPCTDSVEDGAHTTLKHASSPVIATECSTRSTVSVPVTKGAAAAGAGSAEGLVSRPPPRLLWTYIGLLHRPRNHSTSDGPSGRSSLAFVTKILDNGQPSTTVYVPPTMPPPVPKQDHWGGRRRRAKEEAETAGILEVPLLDMPPQGDDEEVEHVRVEDEDEDEMNWMIDEKKCMAAKGGGAKSTDSLAAPASASSYGLSTAANSHQPLSVGPHATSTVYGKYEDPFAFNNQRPMLTPPTPSMVRTPPQSPFTTARSRKRKNKNKKKDAVLSRLSFSSSASSSTSSSLSGSFLMDSADQHDSSSSRSFIQPSDEAPAHDEVGDALRSSSSSLTLSFSSSSPSDDLSVAVVAAVSSRPVARARRPSSPPEEGANGADDVDADGWPRWRRRPDEIAAMYAGHVHTHSLSHTHHLRNTTAPIPAPSTAWGVPATTVASPQQQQRTSRKHGKMGWIF